MRLFILILLLSLFVNSTNAQVVGGVGGAELWVRTVPADKDSLQYKWLDLSGDSILLVSYGKSGSNSTSEFIQEKKKTHTINFHPALNLSESGLPKVLQLKYSDLSQATVFGVFCPDLADISKDQILYGINSQENQGVIVTTDKAARVEGIDPLDYGSEEGEDLMYSSADSKSVDEFKESAIRMATYLKADHPTHSVWGSSSKASVVLGTSYSSDSKLFNTLFDSKQVDGSAFKGYVPELIVFGRWLTPGERVRVESYLAMRYGITVNSSYLDSEGNLVWDMAENAAYHNRVVALGREDKSHFQQYIATTANEQAPKLSADSKHDCAKDHLVVMSIENDSVIQDNTYTLWGDDNAPLTTYKSTKDTLLHIMTRKWMLRNNSIYNGTRYKVELNHTLTANSEFTNYSRGRSMLLIDPTGVGNFESDDVIAVLCAEPDAERSKTIFNNIEWDSDNNGSDCFTFAYYDGMLADVTPTPTACNNGNSLNDGSIYIKVNLGTPPYTYILKADSVPGITPTDIVSEGVFFSKENTISSLAPGAYNLELYQGGGTVVHGKGGLIPYLTHVHTKTLELSGDFSWIVADTESHYRIGIEPSISEDVTQYGFDVKGEWAHVIIKGYTSLTQAVKIKRGDKLRVRVKNFQVVYYHNDKEILRETEWTLQPWRLCIKFGNGDSHIVGLTFNNKTLYSFESRGNVQIETPSSHMQTYKVYVGNGCIPDSFNGVIVEKDSDTVGDDPDDSEDDSTLKSGKLLVRTNSFVKGEFSVELLQDEPSAATLMLFNLKGKLMHEQEMDGDRKKVATFNTPGPGIYVIKVFTNGEYTAKILSK